jgi:hypothetical protein
MQDVDCDVRWGRHVGQDLAARPAERKLAGRPALDLVALFVDRAVVPAAEQGKVRQRGGTALGPVTDVMALADSHSTAGEAAAPITVVEGSA